jgi:hypothetical protein
MQSLARNIHLFILNIVVLDSKTTACYRSTKIVSALTFFKTPNRPNAYTVYIDGPYNENVRSFTYIAKKTLPINLFQINFEKLCS